MPGYSSIAQSVERMTVNHDVTGSSPVRGVNKDKVTEPCPLHRGIVQLVEYRSPKPQVLGSNPSAPGKSLHPGDGDLFILPKNGG